MGGDKVEALSVSHWCRPPTPSQKVEWVDAQHLRRLAEAPAPVKGHETSVRVGGYHCVAIGSVQSAGGHLQTMPGFEIVAGSGYVHQDGLRGSISFDASQRVITFHGSGWESCDVRN
jgi:hypothetical protein